MSINKFTDIPKPSELKDKVNEIIDGKQDTLVSGSNIKTINGVSLVGSGNLTQDVVLPSQSGQDGKFLRTNGSTASWGDVSGRNPGEIVESSIPLVQAGLHELNGAVLSGSGSYADFVEYMADLYESDPNSPCFTHDTTMTTYNFTGVGSLVCENGILSGFIDENSGSQCFTYATVPAVVPASQMELVIKCKITSIVNAARDILDASASAHGIVLRVAASTSSTANLNLWVGGGSSNFINGSATGLAITLNQDLWFKLTWDGATYKCYGSTDGTTWTDGASFAKTTAPAFTDGFMCLGGAPYQKIAFKDGLIDLNESYLICDNEFIWKGKTVTNYTAKQMWDNSYNRHGFCDKYYYNSSTNELTIPVANTKHGALIDSGTQENWTYRIYSDGWCEQWYSEMAPYGAVASTVTIHFPKSYIDCNYTVEHSLNSALTGSMDYGYILIKRKCTNALTFSYNMTGQQIYVAGYVDISDYQVNPIYRYLVVGNSVKTDVEVDIDNIAADLDNKADKDLANVSNQSGFRRLVEISSPSIAPDWYKVYEEYDPVTGNYLGKWCEQGCYSQYEGAIQFRKSFSSTNYTFTATSNSTAAAHYANKTASGIELWWGDSATSTSEIGMWYACGYLAE